MILLVFHLFQFYDSLQYRLLAVTVEGVPARVTDGAVQRTVGCNNVHI